MKTLEIEFKWEANSARAFKCMEEAILSVNARMGRAQEMQITDVYVDTPARDFEKEQIAMRVRKVGSCHWEATFKTRTEIVNGKAVRREETCALPKVKNFHTALRVLQEKKRWKGLNVSCLCPLFTVHNKRCSHPITFRRTKAELALDTCKLLVCGRRIFFKEIELELKQGSADTLGELASVLTQKTRLQPARVSKVKTAVTLMRLWERT
ncbi:MAG: CYTH domain-containing protein [Elusimicrobiaceae bacterium]|nr:CYTH domain-containing protein [Elusimicrobiaceae bacterium]